MRRAEKSALYISVRGNGQAGSLRKSIWDCMGRHHGVVGCHAIPWLGFFDRVARAITSSDVGYPSELICLADNSCGSYCCALGVEPTSHVSEALERRNHARLPKTSACSATASHPALA